MTPPIFGRATITLGIGHILVLLIIFSIESSALHVFVTAYALALLVVTHIYVYVAHIVC